MLPIHEDNRNLQNDAALKSKFKTFNMAVNCIQTFMRSPKMKFIFISELNRSKPRLKLNEILNQVSSLRPKGEDYSGFFEFSSWSKKIRTTKLCIICKDTTFLNCFNGIYWHSRWSADTVQSFRINILRFYLRHRGII